MPLYIADYLADTAHLRAAQSGAYLHLIMHYWLHGSLPNDDAQLAAIARMEPREWKKSRATLEAFFKPGWVHSRIEKELEEAKLKHGKRVKAGKAGAEARANNKQCSSNAQATTITTTKNISEAKASGAEAPIVETLEAKVYRVGKEVLGKPSGGVITNLRKHCRQDLQAVCDLLEQAKARGDPMEWIQGILRRSEAMPVSAKQLFPDEIYQNVL